MITHAIEIIGAVIGMLVYIWQVIRDDDVAPPARATERLGTYDHESLQRNADFWRAQVGELQTLYADADRRARYWRRMYDAERGRSQHYLQRAQQAEQQRDDLASKLQIAQQKLREMETVHA